MAAIKVPVTMKLMSKGSTSSALLQPTSCTGSVVIGASRLKTPFFSRQVGPLVFSGVRLSRSNRSRRNGRGGGYCYVMASFDDMLGVFFRLFNKQVVIKHEDGKCITTVEGLQRFGVELSDASEKLGERFTTGCDVVEGPTQEEQIELQGYKSKEKIADFIIKTWRVPKHAIVFE